MASYEDNMNFKFVSSSLSAFIFWCAAAQAQSPVTATCNDGSAYSGSTRSGACGHHGGVKAFDTPSAAKKVWVNTASKVYHCPNDPHYGKTNVGSYMTEASAKAAGARPSAGKVCF